MNIFQEFIASWKNDWHTNRLLFWLESSGTGVSMLASILLAWYATAPPMWIIFGLWLYGALAMSTAFYMRRNGSAMVLMLWYVGINTVGLTNLFLDWLS